MSVPLERLQFEARRVAGWTTTALGVTIPVWVVADGVLVVLLLLCWLAGGDWRERMRRVLMNPVALSALLLFGWLLVGTLGRGLFRRTNIRPEKIRRSLTDSCAGFNGDHIGRTKSCDPRTSGFVGPNSGVVADVGHGCASDCWSERL